MSQDSTPGYMGIQSNQSLAFVPAFTTALAWCNATCIVQGFQLEAMSGLTLDALPVASGDEMFRVAF